MTSLLASPRRNLQDVTPSVWPEESIAFEQKSKLQWCRNGGGLSLYVPYRPVLAKFLNTVETTSVCIVAIGEWVNISPPPIFLVFF